uniref:Uncharacterized protein n=1 Tax=Arundo donax TaxID=35708 RepID=A0A0A8ZER5_ARUDO
MLASSPIPCSDMASSNSSIVMYPLLSLSKCRNARNKSSAFSRLCLFIMAVRNST